MDPDVRARRHKLATLQHERVLEEAAFVAQLTRQARNRATAAPVHPRKAAFAADVRQRMDYEFAN